MTNQQLRYFYHWPHFLYRIGYWITYQIECLIKEIMFEWVRDKLQTMLDLEMWAHLKMNKKHQIKTLGALPCTFCPVISKIALYLSLCFFAGWVGFSLLPCHRLLKLLKTTPGGHLPRLHCSINWNLSEITILSKCAHWSLGQVHVKTLCFKVQAKLSQKVQLRGAPWDQICSFFENCSKSLLPPPPSFWTSCCKFFLDGFLKKRVNVCRDKIWQMWKSVETMSNLP